MTWNCTGGVLLSLADENGKTASTSYTDLNFWRPESTTDQLSNVTLISYLSPTRNQVAWVGLTAATGDAVQNNDIACQDCLRHKS
jgi:hypothetical protein